MDFRLFFAGFALVAALAGCARSVPGYEDALSCRAPAPDDVRIVWLGAAGVYVGDGNSGVLIDPFVSQANARALDVAFGRALVPDKDAVARTVAKLGPVDAIVVTHSHYDHVLDVAEFARLLEVPVYGSPTTALIVQGHGLARDQIRVMRPGDEIGAKAFRVRVHRGAHGQIILGQVPWPGVATAPVPLGAAASAFRVGQVYVLEIAHATGSVLYTGSAGVVPGMADGFAPAPAVTAVLTLTGRGDTAAYLAATAGAVGAARVVPIHFDDLFTVPQPVPKVLASAEFDEFAETLARTYPDMEFAPQRVGQSCAAFATQ